MAGGLIILLHPPHLHVSYSHTVLNSTVASWVNWVINETESMHVLCTHSCTMYKYVCNAWWMCFTHVYEKVK